jgi:hypothetical protein
MRFACLDGEDYELLDALGAALLALRGLKDLLAGWHELYSPLTCTNTQLSDVGILNKAIHQKDKS